MASPISTAVFTNHVFPSLRYMLIDEGYDPASILWPMIVRREDSDLEYEDIAGETSFGYLAKKSQGGPIAYDLPIQGSTKRYTNAVYALGFKINNVVLN